MALPVARVEVVRETLYGTPVEDPYRWMEDWKSAETLGWLNGQAAFAREILDALPHRADLLARINTLGDASPAVYGLQIAGGHAFYLRRDPGENTPKLVVRATPDAPEKVLLDTNTMTGEAHTTIDWYAPSRDGQRIAYGLSQGGSEESVLHVMEVEGDEQHAEAITRTRFGGVVWLEDNRSFVYSRMRDQPADAPLTERYNDMKTHLHRLGDDPDGDPAVWGRGVTPGVEMAAQDFPFLGITSTSDTMIGAVIHGVLNEQTLYAAPRASLADPATIPWRKVCDVEDAVTGFELHGDRLFLKTHKNAPRYTVVATSATQPDLATAQTIVPPGERVIEDMRVAGDYLLIRDLDGGIGRLRRIALAGGALEDVALPFDGTIVELANEKASADLFMQLTSWTVSPRIFRYNAATGDMADTGWRPASPVDFSAIEAHEVFATAKDGTHIPLSIIHKKGLKLDGSNPTLLMSYGSYGITINPAFNPLMLAWYERGGVYAIGHVRGGGEYGEEWHKAGQKLNKGNTVDDFIACAEYLVKEGYTSPAHLAGEGTSAGGVPSGGALVKRPDLWAVMVIRVAVVNFLRFEFSENGPPNVPEFGSISTEEGFRGLQIMDSYTKVADGTAYPAVLLTTGLNDPRVVAWQATKMAARLQAATSSGKPVLLRAEVQGGHGMGASKNQIETELADKLAFLLAQFGA